MDQLAEDGFGLAVGFGDGALVVFTIDGEVAGAEAGEDLCGAGGGELAEEVGKFGVIHFVVPGGVDREERGIRRYRRGGSVV